MQANVTVQRFLYSFCILIFQGSLSVISLNSLLSTRVSTRMRFVCSIFGADVPRCNYFRMALLQCTGCIFVFFC